VNPVTTFDDLAAAIRARQGFDPRPGLSMPWGLNAFTAPPGWPAANPAPSAPAPQPASPGPFGLAMPWSLDTPAAAASPPTQSSATAAPPGLPTSMFDNFGLGMPWGLDTFAPLASWPPQSPASAASGASAANPLGVPSNQAFPPVQDFGNEPLQQPSADASAQPRKFTIYDMWPMRLLHSALMLPRDVLTGQVPIRDENGDYNRELIRRAFDLAALGTPITPAALVRARPPLGSAYHYTFDKRLADIEADGLMEGTYTTPTGNLSPTQAHIDLALPPNRGLPNVLIRLDLDALRRHGYEIPPITQVGRNYNMPGGGFEMRFPYKIGRQYFKVIGP
jgi:hypothetical protein